MRHLENSHPKLNNNRRPKNLIFRICYKLIQIRKLYFPVTTISTLLFNLRPSSVSLLAIGLVLE